MKNMSQVYEPETVEHCLCPWYPSHLSLPDSHFFDWTTSCTFLAHPDAYPIKVRRNTFGSRQTCHSRNSLISLLIFLVPKIGIIKLIFTVAIFVIEGFDYFTTSKENMLTYFIDDLVMVGCGNQASSRYSRCPGRKYVIWEQKKIQREFRASHFGEVSGRLEIWGVNEYSLQSTSKKEVQWVHCGSFWILESIYWATPRVTRYEWGQE